MSTSRFLMLVCVFAGGFLTSTVVPKKERPRSALDDAVTPPAIATVVHQGPLSASGSLPVMLTPLGEVKEGDGLIKVTILDGKRKSEAFVVIPATGQSR